MSEALLDDSASAIPLHGLGAPGWEAAASHLSPAARAAAKAARFLGKAGQCVIVPDADGGVSEALLGLGDQADSPNAWRAAPALLPPGDYRLAAPCAPADPTALAIAWAAGAYRFDRYLTRSRDARPRLVLPPGADAARVSRVAAACALARDMVNAPANDMGPAEIEATAREIASTCGASVSVVAGEALLTEGYPAVHAVGRAAAAGRAPRLIELTWGEASHPVLALVGKGVSFDTGGLDLKPSAGMRLMKKDMGGAAHALALGRLVMTARLPVRLVVLIAAVENAVSGEAMRPGDIIASRKGLSIEIGNTDAEGRLILADALTRAAEHRPSLTLDFATLTGAARVALGPEVVPFYTDDETLAGDLAAASRTAEDPLWRMPLWPGYAKAVESDVADLKNDPDAWAQAGSVTAALFLKRFAPEGAWAHFDIYAWNPRGRPGWPVGAEAQTLRALDLALTARFPPP
ncbi:MAG: leucyl aminopeptidase family protein [Alphaproteobacteria bacterium]|nr:leucyl aminopeptidase family protein [Alphaproteobacteria bacterium]